jgi:hypothetical protein
MHIRSSTIAPRDNRRPPPIAPSMQVREYKQSDLAQLEAIHASQGFDYAFPDLSNPLFVTKLVLTDADADKNRRQDADATETANEKILAAAFLRLTAETYLLLDPNAGVPRDRWQSLLALHAATQRDAWHRGLEDVHAWLPPQIAKKFGRRLQRLGWIRDDAWTPYCKKLDATK